MVRNLRTVIISAVLLFMMSGCGYSRASKAASLTKGRSLHAALFVNRAFQPNLEAEFRKALLNELVLRGEEIRPENEADLLLTGDLDAGTVAISSYSSTDRAVIHSITLTVVMQLSERESGRIIWKYSETQKQEYPAANDLGLQRNNRDAAMSALCNRIARLAVCQMDQAF